MATNTDIHSSDAAGSSGFNSVPLGASDNYEDEGNNVDDSKELAASTNRNL
eukprot:CAMPEP_0197830072 /NCGR_PEP_ID=MMETSP1437-20131217/6665_1 /TAXON_ID=49252 ORGANISM="Eucampia antarctica, Strain CCMP1452" /NCGR_SAMPLE_ID=MMETSP1437 /ASSEMBLY_ACC=CAM_ASM_001096 /LENGTH=50 /DNA_ID=CAMNT_0043432209 /DNA_START=55 /DNA_END=204 /DNA_ORIENTATION=+